MATLPRFLPCARGLSLGFLFVFVVFYWSACEIEDLVRVSFLEVETLPEFSSSETILLQGSLSGLIEGDMVAGTGFIYSQDRALIEQNMGERITNNIAADGNFTDSLSTAGLDLDVTYFYKAFAFIDQNDIKYAPNIEEFTTSGIRLTNIAVENEGIISLARGRVSPMNKVSRFGHIWINTDTGERNMIDGVPESDNESYTTRFYNLIPGDNYKVQAFAFAAGNTDPVLVPADVNDSGFPKITLDKSDFWLQLDDKIKYFDKDTLPLDVTTGAARVARSGGINIALQSNDKSYALIGLGKNENGVPLADFWLYDPDTGTWQELVPEIIIPARFHAISFVLTRNGSSDQIAYFGTGRGTGIDIFNDLYSFDPASMTFAAVPVPPLPARHSAYAFTIDNIAYVGGGIGTVVDTFFTMNNTTSSCECICNVNKVGTLEDLWSFNQSTWSKIDGDISNNRELLSRHAAVVYSDKAAGRGYVLFGAKIDFSAPANATIDDCSPGATRNCPTECEETTEPILDGFWFANNTINHIMEPSDISFDALLYPTNFSLNTLQQGHFGGGYTSLDRTQTRSDIIPVIEGQIQSPLPECGLGQFAEGVGFELDGKIYAGFGRDQSIKTIFWVYVPEEP